MQKKSNKPVFTLFLSAIAGLAMLPAAFQAAAQSTQQPQQQQTPQQQTPPGTGSGNDFPGEDSNVPVLPGTGTAETRAKAGQPENPPTAEAQGEDRDPARSPDTGWGIGGKDAGSVQGGPDSDDGFSSSLAGMHDVLPKDDDIDPHRKPVVQKTPEQVFKEDVNVGLFYMERKNWKGALARFQSAYALNTENPDVMFNLAEAERRLNMFTQAKQHYQLLLEDDPDGPYTRAAKKALAQPEVANAPLAAPEAKQVPTQP